MLNLNKCRCSVFCHGMSSLECVEHVIYPNGRDMK